MGFEKHRIARARLAPGQAGELDNGAVCALCALGPVCTQTAVGRSVTTLGWPIHLIQPEERFHGAPESRRVAGAPTCRHEPPKPAVIEQAARGVCGVGSGAARIQRRKAQKSDTNANVLPFKSPWSSQLKSVLNFPPRCLLGVGVGGAQAASRFPRSQVIILPCSADSCRLSSECTAEPV